MPCGTVVLHFSTFGAVILRLCRSDIHCVDDIVAVATVISSLCSGDIHTVCGLRKIQIYPLVIPSMSSEKTCLQGFPNDDIFGVIAFALVQIKAVGLRYMRTITAERSVGIQPQAHFRSAGFLRRNDVAPLNDMWQIFNLPQLRQSRNFTVRKDNFTHTSCAFHSRFARISLADRQI